MYHMIEETPEFFAFYRFYLIATITFVVVAGVSLILRHARRKGATTLSYYRSIAIKCLVLFIIAMFITLFTWLFSVFISGSGSYIQFGFLHMLSISMFLSLLFLRFGKWNLLIGTGFVLFGLLVIPQLAAPAWLYPLGIHSAEFLISAMEYFPLLPWFGVLLIGVGLGSVFYPQGVRRFELRECGKIGHALAKIGNGKVTLIVYLVHAPVIMLILGVISMVFGIGGL